MLSALMPTAVLAAAASLRSAARPLAAVVAGLSLREPLQFSSVKEDAPALGALIDRQHAAKAGPLKLKAPGRW